MADPTKDPIFNKFAEMQPQMPNIDPNVLSKVPGIQNVKLANAPTFSPEGVATYPEIGPTISAPPPQVAQVQPQTQEATPFSPSGGAGFLPASSVPSMAAPDPNASFMGDVSTGLGKVFSPFIDHSQSVGGFEPQAPTPQSPFGLADPSSSTAPTGEDPFAGPVVTPQTPPQVDPNQQIRLADPTSSTVGGLTTQGGIPLSQFLSGAAIPEAGYAAESPMYAEDSQSRGLTGQAGRDAFAQASLDREARQDQMLQSRVQSREDQRGGADGELSMADAVDMTGGDRDKARAMVLASRQPEEKESLTFDQKLKLAEFEQKKSVNDYKVNQDKLIAEGKADEAYAQDEAKLRSVSGGASRVGDLVNKAIGITTEAGTTGLSGAILKNIPGTDANKLKSVLEVVKSKVALDRLAELKSTGATLGQIAVAELEMLQQSYDTLQQNLQGEPLRAALINYAENLQKTERIVAEKFKAKYGEEKYNTVMGGGLSPSQQSNAQPSGNALVDKWNK